MDHIIIVGRRTIYKQHFWASKPVTTNDKLPKDFSKHTYFYINFQGNMFLDFRKNMGGRGTCFCKFFRTGFMDSNWELFCV